MDTPLEKPLRKKVGKVVLWVCVILLLMQFGTYYWYAESVIPCTAIRSLNSYIALKHNDGRKYVVLEPEAWVQLKLAQRNNLLSELHSFTVYHSINQVREQDFITRPTTEADRMIYPEWVRIGVEAKTLDRLLGEIAKGRHVVGLKNGVLLHRFNATGSGFFWMSCKAEGQDEKLYNEDRESMYIWVLGFWVRVRDYLPIIY